MPTMPATDVTDIIDTVEVLDKSFTDETTGRAIQYNQVRIVLSNGDEITLKPKPEALVILRYALREAAANNPKA